MKLSVMHFWTGMAGAVAFAAVLAVAPEQANLLGSSSSASSPRLAAGRCEK